MIDASSKFPYTALVKSTPRDYGDYDECVEIDHKYADGRILGQHCLFGLAIADPLKLPIAPVSSFLFYIDSLLIVTVGTHLSVKNFFLIQMAIRGNSNFSLLKK